MKKMHVSLYVSDLNKTVNFYNSFFNEEAAKVKERYAKYELDQPGLVISFIENEAKVQSTFGHLGFRVDSQDELMMKMLESKQHGLAIKEEMGTSCCYAKQDKYWVQDPDGYQWEVYYFHEDVEFNDPHYELKEDKKVKASSNCC